MGRVDIMLSGGSSPKRLYEILSLPPFDTTIDWKNYFCFLEMNVVCLRTMHKVMD